jgi:hypothetical protein
MDIKTVLLVIHDNWLNSWQDERIIMAKSDAHRAIVMDTEQNFEKKLRGAGGTSGGLGQFLLGLVMSVAGGYLLTNQVTVSSGYWNLWGYNAFGLSLLPLIFGIGFLFFNGRSIIGWGLTLIGVVVIFTGIIANLNIYFQPTSLYNTIITLVLLAGGIGLIARSLKAQ